MIEDTYIIDMRKCDESWERRVAEETPVEGMNGQIRAMTNMSRMERE